MGENEKKKKETKEKGRYYVEETLQSKPPQEPDSSSESMKWMLATTPKEPNDVSPFKRKKPTKQTDEKKRAREQGESEGE